MANANIIAMKAQRVEEIKEKIEKAQSMIIFDYRGLTVSEVTSLRSDMRKAGVEYVVIKNSIVERAVKAANIDESVLEMLKGPSAFAFGYEDPVAPAKILKESIKKFKKCAIKGGIVDGAVMSAADVEKLADLPSREQLLSRMLGSILSPISGLAIVLDQIAKQKASEQ